MFCVQPLGTYKLYLNVMIEKTIIFCLKYWTIVCFFRENVRSSASVTLQRITKLWQCINVFTQIDLKSALMFFIIHSNVYFLQLTPLTNQL
jgi:hypothetical protein